MLIYITTTYFVDKVDNCNTCYKHKDLINCKYCSWSSCSECWLKWIKKDKNSCPHCTTINLPFYLTLLVFEMNYNKYYLYYYNYYKSNSINILKNISKSYLIGYYYCDIKYYYFPKPDIICNVSNDLWILRIFIYLYKGYMIQLMGIFLFILISGSFLQICVLCSIINNCRK